MAEVNPNKEHAPDFYFHCRPLKYGNVYDILKNVKGKGVKKIATYYPRTDKLTVLRASINGVYSLLGMEEWFEEVKKEMV